jgi:hypothetical protein
MSDVRIAIVKDIIGKSTPVLIPKGGRKQYTLADIKRNLQADGGLYI